MFRVRQLPILRVRRAVMPGADMKTLRIAAATRMDATRDTAAVRTKTLTDAIPGTARVRIHGTTRIPATPRIPGTIRLCGPAATAGDRMEAAVRKCDRQVCIARSRATPEGVRVPGTASPATPVLEMVAVHTGAVVAEIAPIRAAGNSAQSYKGDAYKASPFSFRISRRGCA